ncbi:uncharacterized protein [Eucyclogobius newberryi]|uniref:uncharacterized protein n=1 Tax=Eucyclogobius newberryi TaxID=166745 RepID=UPI003B59C94E
MWPTYLSVVFSSSMLDRAVSCDFCSEPKSRATRFCRDCSSSFCDTHLQPHFTVQGLKRHQLQGPGDRPDLLLNSLSTSRADPQNGAPVYESLSVHTGPGATTGPRVHTGPGAYSRRIQQRQGKVQELRAVMEQSRRTADLKASEVVQVFNAVVQEVQRSLEHFSTMMEESQSHAHDHAQGMIQELENEIQELSQRESEEQRIYVHSQRPAPRPLRDWDSVFVEPTTYEQGVAQVVCDLEERVALRLRPLLVAPSLQRLRSFAVRLTLEPKTAQRPLVVSSDLREVHHKEEKSRSSSQSCHVRTRQRFCSGRFYFEVLVQAKSAWDVGVARKSVKEKKKAPQCPALGFWMLQLRDGVQYQALENPPVPLVLGRGPQKVGIFVDYDLGLVSFYDADSAALIYSFTACTFREEIVPVLNPGLSSGGRNAAPLVLTQVQMPEERLLGPEEEYGTREEYYATQEEYVGREERPRVEQTLLPLDHYRVQRK